MADLFISICETYFWCWLGNTTINLVLSTELHICFILSGLVAIFMKEPRTRRNMEFAYFQVICDPQVIASLEFFCCVYYSSIETLQIRLGMEPYIKEVETRYKLSPGDTWLRETARSLSQFFHQQHLKLGNYFSRRFESLPPLPVSPGKARLTLKHLLRNETFYVTTEVLSAYSKPWEKSTNIWAS